MNCYLSPMWFAIKIEGKLVKHSSCMYSEIINKRATFLDFLLTVVLEKTLESSLDFKEIKPVHPKGNQSWMFIGRTDAEVPTLWPPGAKNRLIGKDPDAGKNWKQEEKGKTEDKMVGWHHWVNGQESEQTPGDGKGQESLVCCSSRVHKDSGLSYWIITTLLMTVFGKESCKTGLRVLRKKFLF